MGVVDDPRRPPSTALPADPPALAPEWLFATIRDLGAKLAAVEELLTHAAKVSPSDTMPINAGDLRHALRQQQHRAPSKNLQ